MQRLPIEIMTYIAGSLDLHDIFNLSLVCSQFRYFANNEDICRAALETNASYSAEAHNARSSKQYARCLRRLVKTWDAIATAAPYSTAVVAEADEFVYCGGMLCYTHGHESLRLLHLHGSAESEIVIETRTLLQSVLGPDLANSRYKFRPLYFAYGIVSCLYSPPKSEGRSRLIILDLQQKRLLAAHRLESTSKLFVRNNSQHLYYGTHSLTGDDGFKRWVLKRFDICKEQWAPGQLDLEDLVGSDIGSTVCFEIIDNHFYGLSSLNTFEVYETDWTSYYYGFRLPVGRPIDDRWSTLQLEKDLATGDIMVSECRREWLVDECSSTRTSYRTVLRFSNRHNRSNDDSDSDHESGTENNGIPPIHPCSASTIALAKRQRESSEFHRGDNGSTTPAITLSQCFIRSYNHSCETFIDLVNDPDASESMTRRLQLRSISRSSHVGNKPRLREPLAGSSEKRPLQPSTLNKTSWWPPKIDVSQNTTCLAELDTLLNPKDHATYGPISGTMDDRSMIYAVGSRASQSKRPLVFISFDPAIRLPNLNYWPGGPKTLRRTRPKTQGDDTTDPCPYPTPESLPTSEPASRNSSFSEGSFPTPRQPSTSLRPDTCRLDAPTWLRRTPAAYLQSAYTPGSPLGFNFAYGGDHSTSCRS
ncbi:f-box domain-containing protein [Colletotrichum incanum]|uniref:F-box domain-containing protein n=1 Tax=Colletotrichum incanum TaxID=1573173 RepID=A0A167CAV7_COLIC|nr:f-box domain-containing protein [Colletotrichum incanum]